MPTLTRRAVVLSATATTLTLAGMAAAPLARASQNHRVLMLNTGAGMDGDSHPNVFDPLILYAEPGDTVTFVPSDAGHNAASKRGMLPDGAEAWNGAVDEELTVTLTEPGIYGYLCLPHYEMGMVGLIVVGDTLPNYREAKRVRHPGDARKVFRALFKQLEQERPELAS